MEIGYQGDYGSNAEAATIQYLSSNGIEYKSSDIIPLINSATAVKALKEGRVDLIVVATKNSIAGIVKETQDAIKDLNLKIIDTVVLPIHHCLFKKRGVSIDRIDTIASHIQALNQTKINRKIFFPQLKEKEMIDTALSAKNLRDGDIGDNNAVLCRENVGMMYGLELVKPNLEDRADNFTEFKVFALNPNSAKI